MKSTYRLDIQVCLEFDVVVPLFTFKMVYNTKLDCVNYTMDKKNINSTKLDKRNRPVSTYKYLNFRSMKIIMRIRKLFHTSVSHNCCFVVMTGCTATNKKGNSI